MNLNPNLTLTLNLNLNLVLILTLILEVSELSLPPMMGDAARSMLRTVVRFIIDGTIESALDQKAAVAALESEVDPAQRPAKKRRKGNNEVTLPALD